MIVALMLQAVSIYESSVSFCETTQLNIPADSHPGSYVELRPVSYYETKRREVTVEMLNPVYVRVL
jgi:hypothetical protein